MKLLVSGAGGFIGSALVARLAGEGHQVVRLVRAPRGGSEIVWDPMGRALNPGPLEGIEGVVHLAGEPIAEGRWTPSKKASIRVSRVVGTQRLCEALTNMPRPPAVLVCASAIGYYGDRGDETLTEESPSGTGFLAGLCREWEAATSLAAGCGIRVVHARIGIVLSPKGGALKKMLLPFRLGLGGPLGHGRQIMSWISLDDTVGAIRHALITGALRGAANVTAPRPVTNREFSSALGRALSRPAIAPVPAVALRLLFGQLADEALLSSARVVPAKLQQTGYAFRHPDLDAALRHVLKAS